MSDMKITLIVTEKDIREGIRANANRCAVSNSIRRRMRKMHPGKTIDIYTGLGGSSIYLMGKNDPPPQIPAYRFHPENHMGFTQYIRAFDSGESIEPARFAGYLETISYDTARTTAEENS